MSRSMPVSSTAGRGMTRRSDVRHHLHAAPSRPTALAKASLDGEWQLDLAGDPARRDALPLERDRRRLHRDRRLGNAIPIAGFTTQTLNLSGGATSSVPLTLENGVEFVPEVGFKLGVAGSGACPSLSDPFGTALVGFSLAGEIGSSRSVSKPASLPQASRPPRGGPGSPVRSSH